jgi:ATP-binding cassette subfamily F protein uup
MNSRAAEQLVGLQDQMERFGAWQLEFEAKRILTLVGISNASLRTSSMSGGQRKRVALARALIQPCQLLILDEPTNHLDEQTAHWLESYLQNRKGALLMVTHDRYFLQRVATRIFELDRAHLYSYVGGYETFLAEKLSREEGQKATEAKRQNFLRTELDWIRRGPRARGTKQKARTDKFYEVLEAAPESAPSAVELASGSSRLGRKVIELSHVAKSYGERLLFSDFSYSMVRQDRIGIVGPNGVGKSTLLRLLAGKISPDVGSVEIGSTVRIGYFAQELDDLNDRQRVLEYVREEHESIELADGKRVSASQMLERFLFAGTSQYAPIGKLSGGERRRLVLLKILMSAPNVLLLDEPTNDLDVSTLSVLESFLDDFPGAVVVVSHDRYFLDRVTDKLFVLDGSGCVEETLQSYSEILARWAGAAPNRSEPPKSPSGANPQMLPAEKVPEARPLRRKLTYAEQMEYRDMEANIAQTERLLAEVQEQMERDSDDYVKLQKLFDEQTALNEQLDELLERWAFLQDLQERV